MSEPSSARCPTASTRARAGSTATASTRSNIPVKVEGPRSTGDRVTVDYSGQRAAGQGRRERHPGDDDGRRGDPVPLLHRPRHPAQPRVHSAHRGDRARRGRSATRGTRPRPAARRSSRRPHAGRRQPGDGRRGPGPGPGRQHPLREHPAVRRGRRRGRRALGLHALHQRRRPRARPARTDGWPLLSSQAAPRRDEVPADRAARAAVSDPDRAGGDRARVDGLRPVDRRPRHPSDRQAGRRRHGLHHLRRRRARTRRTAPSAARPASAAASRWRIATPARAASSRRAGTCSSRARARSGLGSRPAAAATARPPTRDRRAGAAGRARRPDHAPRPRARSSASAVGRWPGPRASTKKRPGDCARSWRGSSGR